MASTIWNGRAAIQNPGNRWKPALASSIKSANVISIDHRLVLRRGMICLSRPRYRQPSVTESR
jgi:hypothetical protein